MAVFIPALNEPLRYVSDYHVKVAGAESNVVIGVQKLGYPAGWISRVSDDEFGYLILNRIRAEGVDTSQVRLDGSHHSGTMFLVRRHKIIAILSNVPLQKTEGYLGAVVGGGIGMVEIALNSPDALEQIRLAKRLCDDALVIGAGTAVTEELAKKAVGAGAA